VNIRYERSYPADPGFWDSEEDHLWARRALWAGYPWRNVELQRLCARRAKGTLIILLLGFIVALRSTRRCFGHQLHSEHPKRVSKQLLTMEEHVALGRWKPLSGVASTCPTTRFLTGTSLAWRFPPLEDCQCAE
jgi:hypothetical protein